MDKKEYEPSPAEQDISTDRKSNSLDGISSASSNDLDETYETYKQQQDARDLDPQEARSVLRKIDLHILPLMMFTYVKQMYQRLLSGMKRRQAIQTAAETLEVLPLFEI